MESLESLFQKVPWARKLFPKIDEAFSNFFEVKRQAEILFLPDLFNENFSSLGWIAYESLNVNIMRRAIETVEMVGHEEAEKFLADYYDEETLKWGLLRFNGHPECRKRLRLLELAKDDYLSGRYHACVPLLLSLMDGLVNDVSKHIGLFAENSNVTAWDSIAAHETGLQSLAKLLGTGRTKTNEEAITIPFRHGILHGRELAFDNKIVAAKCWSALFAVRDWADALANGKKHQKPKERVSWAELLRQLNETAQVKKRLEQWKPRTSDQLDYLQSPNSSLSLPEGTPERVIADFLENWRNARYGKMAEALMDFVNTPLGKKAGQVRRDFGNIRLITYEIISVADEAPAISCIQARLEFENQNTTKNEEVCVRAIYQDSENNPLVRGEGGNWKIVQNGFCKVIYPANL